MLQLRWSAVVRGRWGVVPKRVPAIIALHSSVPGRGCQGSNVGLTRFGAIAQRGLNRRVGGGYTAGMSSEPEAMSAAATPRKLEMKKTERLVIEWSDGARGEYGLEYLRRMCPCASCRIARETKPKRSTSLTVLPGTYSGPITVKKAELVGNYALRIDWSDDHASGIYSFVYLRQIMPAAT
jgi:DUF971 family protein